MPKPRFLMITPSSNWPANAGGRIRSGKIARTLTALGDVRVLSLYHNQPLQTPDGIEEIVMRPSNHLLLWSLRTTEHPLAPVLSGMITARVNRHIKEFQPDIVIFEETVTTGLYDDLDFGAAKTVFSSHNVDCEVLAEMDVTNQEILKNARKDEIRAIENTDYLIACSERDARTFREMTGRNALVLNNPIPDDRCFDIPITAERYANPNFLFVGSMDYAPNTQAIAEIVRDILPHLPDETGATFVGRNGHRLVSELPATGRITLHSDVPDILSYLAEFGSSLLPIRSGGGTRLKALEAMAAGVVVIATEKAVEGLDLVPGTHYVPAETAKQFANAFIFLQADPMGAASLATAARTRVRDTYGRSSFEKTLLTMFRKCLK